MATGHAAKVISWLARAAVKLRLADPPLPAPLPASSGSALLPLESLTPHYDEEQHGTYLRRLEQAIADPDNRNIALTGRYGAGKSSVLDRFEANHRDTVQRLAISALAPAEQSATTTNRIQKEIVKQLLYGAEKKVGKNSRFSKIAVLPTHRAVAESTAAVAAVGFLLYLTGALPSVKWTGADEPSWVRALVWCAAAVVVLGLATTIRVAAHGRFLTDVSAGGTSLKLSERKQTFFDEYLDEIVHYFDRESKDIVVFEDLDRFGDPYIFETLRELNLLLNETPERRSKRRGTSPVPLRFVYAVTDSVFHKLNAASGSDGKRPDDDNHEPARDDVDEAAQETLRANRTKFFDMVIPIVPFISHRNARDLLTRLLTDRGIAGIEAQLINTVAAHCTDMRLLRNICNEYLVFAERLLESARTAPKLEPSRLFALVAYKNFHLADFENITRRDSRLDRLYDFHHDLVRDNIAANESRKRTLMRGSGGVRTRDQAAKRLGERLARYAEAERAKVAQQNYPARVVLYRAGTKLFSAAAISGYEFWAAVATARTFDVIVSNVENGGQQHQVATFTDADLGFFFTEALDAPRWAAYDEAATAAELASIERNIAQLRRADFRNLAASRFTFPASGTGSLAEPASFDDMLELTLTSQLAKDLVRRGFIDQNFSLYAAQFYGDFTGVDVANFMVRHVQSDTMAVDYDLSRSGAVANLIAEAADIGERLLDSVAAFNIDIVNYLLSDARSAADTVVKHLIAEDAEQDAQTFLATFFTTDDSERELLAAALAGHRWPRVYDYLATSDDVPDPARVALMSAALSMFDTDAAYHFTNDVRDFVSVNYADMIAFTGPFDAGDATPDHLSHAETMNAALARADIVIPDLRPLEPTLRNLVVASGRYELTADNLRCALGVSGSVSLDVLRDSEIVYLHCLARLRQYLAAAGSDAATVEAVTTPATLIDVLTKAVASTDPEQGADGTAAVIDTLLGHTSPQARVRNLRSVPASTWAALAAARLFRPSLANVEEYRGQQGSIDADLSALLIDAGAVSVDESGDVEDAAGAELDRDTAAIALLNASDHLSAQERVALALSVEPATPLPVQRIVAEASDLFARIIDAELVADDEVTFAHLSAGGWPAVRAAVAVSANFADFMTPELVDGFVVDLLGEPETAAKAGSTILGDVDSYVAGEDWPALRALARYAANQSWPLNPEVVVRMARVGRPRASDDVQLVLLHLSAAAPKATVEQIVEVFTCVGEPYSKITQVGEKFSVPQDAVHERLLDVLSASKRIRRYRSRGGYAIKVLAEDL